MNKTIIILFLCNILNAYGQEHKTMYINSDSFTVRSYKVDNYKEFEFSFNVTTERNWDRYSFTMSNESLVKRLKDVAVIFKSTSKLNVLDSNSFKGKDFCQNHADLSNSEIIIVKELERNKDEITYQLWKVVYKGSTMNTSNLNSYPFNEELSDKPKRRL